MNENEVTPTTEYDLQSIRERAYRQREAFRRMHGVSAPRSKDSDKVSVSVPERREAGSSLAIISLILGIVSILFFWMMIFIIPVAIIGVFTAVKVIRGKKDKGLGTAALCTSVIGLILAMIMTVFIMTNSDRVLKALDEIENSITSEYGEDAFDDTFGKPFRGPKNMSFPEGIAFSDDEEIRTVCYQVL